MIFNKFAWQIVCDVRKLKRKDKFTYSTRIIFPTIYSLALILYIYFTFYTIHLFYIYTIHIFYIIHYSNILHVQYSYILHIHYSNILHDTLFIYFTCTSFIYFTWYIIQIFYMYTIHIFYMIHYMHVFFIYKIEPAPKNSLEAELNIFRIRHLHDLEFLSKELSLCKKSHSNWVFATNSDFLIPIILQPVFLDLWYFKLLILLDQIV